MSTKLSKDNINEIREIFNFFDKNKSGAIAVKEIGDLYRALGMTPTDAQINDIIAEFDTDCSGTIEFSEFIKIFEMCDVKPITEDQLANAFRLFDQDRNGLISTDELFGIMRLAGEKISREDTELIMKEFDLDDNGSINYNEFARMITSKDI